MLRRSTSILILVMLFAPMMSLAEDVQFYGYVEPQYTYVDTDSGSYQVNYIKLRFDIERQFGDNILMRANYNYIDYSGASFVPYYVVPTSMARGNRNMIPSVPLFFRDSDRLDNAYIRITRGIFTMTAGRQQITYGSGYAWNPTDIFNYKDSFDPTYEQSGVDGVRLDAYLPDWFDATLFYNIDSYWKTSGKLVWINKTIGHFDVAAVYGNDIYIAPRIETVYSPYPYEFYTYNERNMYGWDINGDLFGLGIWTENAYNVMVQADNYWENLVGVDYTFESGLYVMAEYYHNELGKESYKDYSYQAWLKFMTGELKSLARDQIYCYTTYPLTDLLTVGSSAIYAISDKSAALIPTVEYSLADDVVVTLFGNIMTGRQGTMYTHNFGNSFLARIRAYF